MVLALHRFSAKWVILRSILIRLLSINPHWREWHRTNIHSFPYESAKTSAEMCWYIPYSRAEGDLFDNKHPLMWTKMFTILLTPFVNIFRQFHWRFHRQWRNGIPHQRWLQWPAGKCQTAEESDQFWDAKPLIRDQQHDMGIHFFYQQKDDFDHHLRRVNHGDWTGSEDSTRSNTWLFWQVYDGHWIEGRSWWEEAGCYHPSISGVLQIPLQLALDQQKSMLHQPSDLAAQTRKSENILLLGRETGCWWTPKVTQKVEKEPNSFWTDWNLQSASFQAPSDSRDPAELPTQPWTCRTSWSSRWWGLRLPGQTRRVMDWCSGVMAGKFIFGIPSFPKFGVLNINIGGFWGGILVPKKTRSVLCKDKGVTGEPKNHSLAMGQPWIGALDYQFKRRQPSLPM